MELEANRVNVLEGHENFLLYRFIKKNRSATIKIR